MNPPIPIPEFSQPAPSVDRREPASPRSRWSVPLGFVGMVACVLLVETFVGLNSLRFSRIEPDDWYEASTNAQKHLPTGGILILGDSQLKFGVSPLEIESYVGQPVHCLAVQGGQAPTSYFLLRQALEAGMRPSAVVVDFEPHLLRDEPTPKLRMWAEVGDVEDLYGLARASNDPAMFGSMLLAKFLPSYRERFEIRDNLVEAFKGVASTKPAMIAMARRNRGMNRGALIMSKDLGNHQHDYTLWGNKTQEPWRPSKINDLYARKLLRLAKHHQITVYCALQPLAPGVQIKYEQNGIGDRQVRWVQSLQEHYPNLKVIDFRHCGYSDLAFFDPLHMNSIGASAVSRGMGEFLRNDLAHPSPPRSWNPMPPYEDSPKRLAIEDAAQSDALLKAEPKIIR